MEVMTGKMEGNKGENRRGRPRKDSDPQKTGALFDAENVASLELSIGYEDNTGDTSGDTWEYDGTVQGGGAGFSIEDRMRACATLARTSKSEQVRLNAVIKYSELERELRLEQGGEDLGEELAALLAQVKGKTLGQLVQEM